MSSHTLSATRGFLAARDLLRALRDDYEAATARFSWPRPEHFNWALDWFDRIAVDNTRIALRVPGAVSTNSVTYAELSESSNRVANWLRRLGLRRGQRVLLMLDDQLAFCEVMLAVMKLGAVLVLVRATTTAADLSEAIGRAAPALIIAAGQATDTLTAVKPRAIRVCVGDKVPGWHAYTDAYLERRSFSPDGVTRIDDPLLIYATAGKAGRVRMVCHTHAHPIGTLPGTYWTGLLPGDVHVAVTDAGSAEHVWSTFFQPFNAEASVVAVRWTPDAPARLLLDVLGEERVSSLCVTSAAWASLLREDGRLPASIREARSLGAPLARDLADRARTDWGIDVRNGYGQAETGALIGVTAGLTAQPGAIGKSLPGHSIVLINPRTAQPSPQGEEGEICVELAHRPVGLMSGCFGDTESAMASYRGGGFYRTGDLAHSDAAGCLTYAGRVADSVTA
ncbi:AMP-binding protein [Actinocrinis sp.]|uniref:AMP-binding protein n=1 Tax=Actinocrinis sp. TaxID=1920516 RepID=UPI002B874B1D|nr:AMP-binding protein [Actinocrinis sp.]HXR69846.1 AMP-binding protein [Actinocrinis sp.]